MVDIQNQIFSSLKSKITEKFPAAKVQKDFQSTSAVFPTITFYEINNSAFLHSLDYTERKSSLAFQIDIFTTGGTKESQAKAISRQVNEVMEENWHMKRMFANPLPNADKDIYRYTMRYSCKIDEDSLTIYS